MLEAVRGWRHSCLLLIRKFKNQINIDIKDHCPIATELGDGRMHYRCFRAGVNDYFYWSPRMSPVVESLVPPPLQTISIIRKAEITMN